VVLSAVLGAAAVFSSLLLQDNRKAAKPKNKRIFFIHDSFW